MTQQDPHLPNVEIPRDCGETNSMRYVFGYVLTKVFSIHHCDTCRALLVDSSDLFDSSDKLYTYYKNYDQSSNFGNLVVCTEKCFSYLKACEGKLAQYFNHYAHQKHCGAMFVNALQEIPDFPEGCCCDTKILMLKLFVKIRLYFILKFGNRSLIENNRKNTKYLKFCHLGC